MKVSVPAVLLVIAAVQLVLEGADLSTRNADYLGLTAEEKLSRIWDLCKQDQDPGTWFSNLRNAGLLFERMCPTFRAPGDELPGSRKKFIHTVGAVGRVKWRSVARHNYTGIFKVIQRSTTLILIVDCRSIKQSDFLVLKMMFENLK